MSKKPKARRIWLNDDPAMSGSLSWQVYGDGCGYLDIRDCNRSITLDFYHSAKGEKDQALKKLQRIIDELNKFKAEIEKHKAKAKSK